MFGVTVNTSVTANHYSKRGSVVMGLEQAAFLQGWQDNVAL